jgi:ABC-2 type transport system permease protein
MFQTVLALVKKEFYQVRRDKVMLRMIFLMPIIQLLLLGYAINIDVKNIYLGVYDYDRSQTSRDFVQSLTAGQYFIDRETDVPLLEADRSFRENRENAVLVIPHNFSADLDEGRSVTAGMLVDGANASSASIAMGYANLITLEFNQRKYGFTMPVELRKKVLYNPESESVFYMVPGIVALLLTMITVMLTSMAIVREREIGTLEQLLVTPIKKRELLLGKTIPFALLGFLEMSIALAFGVIWFGIPFAGSWPLLYGLSLVFLFTTLGFGIFISTMSNTQQQAMFYAWFFMIFAILTSGLFIPIENMPQVVQYLTYLNPLRYFMVIIRGIMMKGAGVDTLYPNILAMIAFSVVIFTSAWLRFGKRVK